MLEILQEIITFLNLENERTQQFFFTKKPETTSYAIGLDVEAGHIRNDIFKLIKEYPNVANLLDFHEGEQGNDS